MTFAREPLGCFRKFLMQNCALFAVCIICFTFRSKVTNGFLFAIYSYSGSPHLPSGHSANALVSRRVVTPNFRITRVLAFIGNPKIFPSVVKAVPINMVNKLIIFWLTNKSMHVDSFAAIVSNILRAPSIHRDYRAICTAPHVGVPKIRLYQAYITNIYDRLLPAIKANKGKVAIDANLAYTLFHLAGSFRWYGPVEAATSRPATISHFAVGDKA